MNGNMTDMNSQLNGRIIHEIILMSAIASSMTTEFAMP